MNRRGFLAAAIGAVLAPSELAPPVYQRVTYGTQRFVGPLSDAEIQRLGALYASELARSMIETKETVAASILNRTFRSEKRYASRYE